MAEARNKDGILSCPICLEIFQTPVTIPCGHSYCLNCIKSYFLHAKDEGHLAQCPQCRQQFPCPPNLNKNTLLAQMVDEEEMKSKGDRHKHTNYPAAIDGEIMCDVCQSEQAAMSCLVCLMSYCETHLQLHRTLDPQERHKLVKASGSLQDKMCPHHHKLLDVFCCTDQQIICLECNMKEHKGHNTVPVETERIQIQGLAGSTRISSKKTLKMKMDKHEEIKKAVKMMRSSADAAVRENDSILAKLIQAIQRRHAKVTEMIRAQEKAEVSQAKDLLDTLETEIAELKMRDAEMEQLFASEDHVHFLQRFPCLVEPHTMDVDISVCEHISFADASSSLYILKKHVDKSWPQEHTRLLSAVKHIHAVLAPEYKSREEFLTYFKVVSLDPATIHNNLLLSDDDRRVTDSNQPQIYPDCPERFECWPQALCVEEVSGRCYWEVLWKGQWANIAVSYKSINRKKGCSNSRFGANGESWCLRLCRTSSSFWHNNEEIRLPLVARSRIGVYLDSKAGTLSYYSICEKKMTLLHRVQTTFPHKLYPGLGFEFGLTHSPSEIEFADL